MTKKIPTHIKADDAMDKELPAQAIIFERQGWACPVCELNRNKGNHQECAQITQLKHQQELAKKANKPTWGLTMSETIPVYIKGTDKVLQGEILLYCP
jgi:hypothetical protein